MASAKNAKAPSNEPQKVGSLHAMRHSLAHVLTQAVCRMFPGTEYSIGPPIEHGCYHDYFLKKPLTPEDFPKLEKMMRGIIKEGQTFECREFSPAESKTYWEKRGQHFKVEMVEDLVKNEGVKSVTHYVNLSPTGEERFTDLCRGGHVENTKELPLDGFKITHIAGAYWRGDEKRPQLTRVYIAAFPTKEELDQYLIMMEEAKRRDHRKLGQELDLFTFSERVGPGLPLFLPKGEIIKHELERYVREEKEKIGYTFVCIPHIAKKELYITSGHYGKYEATMPVMQDAEGDEYIVKPMNCPHHFELYNSRPHSYRDLPIRYAENTTCYRNERSGELSGLTRVKALTIDDTHHFVRRDQIASEIKLIVSLMERMYKTFGLHDFSVEVSVRDPGNKKNYFGDDAVWSQAEKILVEAAKEWGIPYTVNVGEAAFYGPKIDVHVKDALGRYWQLTTIQLDFVQPENFDMAYVGEDGKRHRPAVLHIAILGSTQRFMGVLIEHFGGLFPLWLAPVQIGVIPVAPPHEEYARKVEKTLKEHGFRVSYLDPTDTLGKRIREGEQRKIPYLLVLGEKEAKSESVAVRNVKTKKQVTLSLGEFLEKALNDIEGRKCEYTIG